MAATATFLVRQWGSRSECAARWKLRIKSCSWFCECSLNLVI